MKVRVEVECTPVEARMFLGLPDVSPLNDYMISEMQRRMEANLSLMEPETLMRSWMQFGGQAQETFFKLMQNAALGAFPGGPGKRPE